MLEFGIRKQGFFIRVSFDETNGDNSVVAEVIDDEGVTQELTGMIIFDDINGDIG